MGRIDAEAANGELFDGKENDREHEELKRPQHRDGGKLVGPQGAAPYQLKHICRKGGE